MTAARRPRVGRAAWILALSLVGAACGSSAETTAPTSTTLPGRAVDGLQVVTLNSQSGDSYGYRQQGREIVVEAPGSNAPVDPNLQIGVGEGVIGEAFWEQGQEMRADQQVCVRLDSVPDTSTPEAVEALLEEPAKRHLPGVALRVRPSIDGSTGHALTVTQRSRNGAVWGFDVNALRIDGTGELAVADRSLAGSAEFDHVVGRIDGLSTGAVTTDMAPPPWHLCARAVGTTITIKVWVDGDEPAWEDPDATRAIEVGSAWVYEGFAGGYELGLSPGQTSIFGDLEVSSPY